MVKFGAPVVLLPAADAPVFPAAGAAGDLSVNRPILSSKAGGLPLTAGPMLLTEAAAAEGVIPDGTLIAISSRTTGSKASDRECSRCGTSRIREVLTAEPSVMTVGAEISNFVSE